MPGIPARLCPRIAGPHRARVRRPHARSFCPGGDMSVTNDTKLLLEGVRAALEESLLVLADDESAAQISEKLREAIAILNRRIESEPRDIDAIDELDRAAAAMKAAAESLDGDELTAAPIAAASRWLSDASERLRRRVSPRPLGPAGALPSTDILASVGTPRAHHANVPAPRVLAADDPAPDAPTFRAAFEALPGLAGEVAQIRAIARDCFEDIASLGSLRKLYDSE